MLHWVTWLFTNLQDSGNESKLQASVPLDTATSWVTLTRDVWLRQEMAR